MAKSTGERESASITADLIATTVGRSRPGRFWNPLERTVSRWSSPARDSGVCSLSRLKDCGLAGLNAKVFASVELYQQMSLFILKIHDRSSAEHYKSREIR